MNITLKNFFLVHPIPKLLFLLVLMFVGYTVGSHKNDAVGKIMKFKTVADIFEQMSRVTSRLQMTELLADLLKQANPQEANIISNLSLGMLRPSYQGTQFNFGKKNIEIVIAQLLNVPPKEVVQKAKKYGDLGLVLEEGTWKTDQELTVCQVYEKLCHLEQISGEGSQEEKQEVTLALLQSVDQLSAKYIVRIILGTLRLGFSDMTILDALSWMEVGNKSLRSIIEDAYNVCADIGLIAQTLKAEGIEALKHMHIKIGIPILPAAAERMPSAQAIFDKIGKCIAQPKFDGFRLQIHIDKTNPKKPIIEFFSRNLIDMSYMFPDLVKELIKLKVKEVIFEGEAIVYDPNTGRFLPFQETVKRKRKHGIEQAVAEFPLQLYLFDILYLNGEELLGKTHEQRRKELLNVMKDSKSETIKIIDEKTITSTKELEEYFYQNIDAGLEGLVVKKSNAVYQPGKRNFNWIKLKRQEEGALEDTIDCVILGYYAGAGKRVHFGIGAFLVGVYNKKKDIFETIAKVGTGLKDEDWVELKKNCDAIQVSEKPINVEVAKELYPDIWVRPEIVCEVRADEITLSPLHSAGKTEFKLGFALRFPRFMRYRSDKNTEQSTSIDELTRMYEDQYITRKKKK